VTEPPPRLEAGEPSPRRGIRGLVVDLLRFDRRAVWILVYVPVSLVVMEYWFIPSGAFKRPLPDWVKETIASIGKSWPRVPTALWPWMWWVAGCLLLFVVLPVVLLRVVAGMRPRDVGLRLRGTGRDAWTYALLFVVFVPVVWLVSQRGDFRATYPFYRPPPGRLGWDLVAFEAAYCLQFLGVETFFRGVMVLGLKPVLGRASVLVMLAPYCMIHFHKPMLEAFGAIGAGAVLGTSRGGRGP
jgi:hypothetical protein